MGKTPKIYSLSVKIPLVISAVLACGIGIISAYYISSQNSSIIAAKETDIRQQAEIIFTSIKNTMLAGEAPVAVQLFRDFTRAQHAVDIRLFRADGTPAFSDDDTIDLVNINLNKKRFVPSGSYVTGSIETSSSFKAAVEDVRDISENSSHNGTRQMVVYKTLINQPKCSTCHGLNHVVRGVIRINASMDDAYSRAHSTVILSTIIYLFTAIIIAGIIVLLIRRFILSRIYDIGSTVQKVGDGDFSVRAQVQSRDEIGDLSSRINTMIDGLNERFKLSKFVSKSTMDHVKNDGDIELGGTKKMLTVLFSDIRGFTKFSEQKDPEYVLSLLNNLMDRQAVVVSHYNGDIDKFVGDEMMAVFDGEDQADRAINTALGIISAIKDFNEDSTEPLNVGIGINTGEMISGNMGSSNRLDRTVIGDEVNLGARLCSIAGPGVIVISEKTRNNISQTFRITEKDPVKVRGKEKPVKIFTVRGQA